MYMLFKMGYVFIVFTNLQLGVILLMLGKAVDMSVDHKPTDELELHRIENAGGHVGPDERVNGGLNLSRAIGTESSRQFLKCL